MQRHHIDAFRADVERPLHRNQVTREQVENESGWVDAERAPEADIGRRQARIDFEDDRSCGAVDEVDTDIAPEIRHRGDGGSEKLKQWAPPFEAADDAAAETERAVLKRDLLAIAAEQPGAAVLTQ